VLGPRRRLWLIEERGEYLLLGEVHLFRLREYICFGSRAQIQRFMGCSVGIAKG
jgi:hypothetical protein